jgi:hypothetical protein
MPQNLFKLQALVNYKMRDVIPPGPFPERAVFLCPLDTEPPQRRNIAVGEEN